MNSPAIESQIVSLRKQGKTHRAIASLLGVKKHVVQDTLASLGMTPKSNVVVAIKYKPMPKVEKTCPSCRKKHMTDPVTWTCEPCKEKQENGTYEQW